MIFESLDDIIKAIKAVEKVPGWVVKAREMHKDLKALVYGDEFKEKLLKIEHIETEKKASARKKYSRSIKDINAKILEPINNVYSATGFNKSYNLPESQKKELLKSLSDVRGGYSLEKWLNIFWSKDLYIVDPSGLMVLEWKDEDYWPTYKSIDCVRDYKSNGLSVEYVIFEPIQDADKDIKYWRVLDDAKDYLIAQNGETFTEVVDKTFDNPFGKCPARVNSDKIKLGCEYRLSFIDAIIETENELLRDRSILTLYKFLNGFATPYRPKVVCPTCRGTAKNGVDPCSDCDGKGYILSKDVTDEIILPVVLDSEAQPTLPNDFAGFISPDLEIWNQYRGELKELFNEAFETTWGTRETEAKDQTAMSVILNTQPMTTKLNMISEVAERHEHSFTEMIANFVIETKSKDENISAIAYGRNYIVQPPEYLLDQYQKSNEAKDPLTVRDKKLTDYITSKYKNDPQNLRIQLLKKDLEPYVHYDIELINDIYGNLEAQKKGLFTDWWETLSQDDMTKTKEVLEENMNKWYESRIKAIVPNNNNE